MSSEPIIRVRNLSKRFPIYANPADRLKQFIFPRVQRLLGLEVKSYYRTFTALSDISFEVQRGETVGVIGRNGAGKSTLLQILCGTLFPTKGSVEINGRIAALLELGAGFNGEYTGRENIFMNARILGLSDEEINARFDDIVKFADIGEHLDQPVKTYSSGMFVRLAFSIIINVNADILIVDEALAVGDTFFQAKCTAKLKSLIESGVTLLFVSHDVHAVKSLCDFGLYLNKGRLASYGDTQTITEAYFKSGHESHSESVSLMSNSQPGDDPSKTPDHAAEAQFAKKADFQRINNGKVNFLDVYLRDESGRRVEGITFNQAVELCYVFQVNEDLPRLGAAYHIRTHTGFDVVYSDTGIENQELKQLKAGSRISLIWRFNVALRESNYSIAAMLSIPKDFSIGDVEVCDFIPLAVNFSVSRGSHLPIYGAVHWPNTLNTSLHVLEKTT